MEPQTAQTQVQMEALGSEVQALTLAQQTQRQVKAERLHQKEQLAQRFNGSNPCKPQAKHGELRRRG